MFKNTIISFMNFNKLLLLKTFVKYKKGKFFRKNTLQCFLFIACYSLWHFIKKCIKCDRFLKNPTISKEKRSQKLLHNII